MKPRLRTSLRSIDSFLKTTHMIRERAVKKTKTLTHVNLHCKDSVKECILYIKSTNRPLKSNNKGQNKPNGSRTDNKRKSFKEINACLLVITCSNQPSYPVDPFASHQILKRTMRN